MLIAFEFENFRSFRERQVFSLLASTGKELTSNVIPVSGKPNFRVLRSCILYGANASGKSNFISAIRAAKQLIIDSAVKQNAIAQVDPFLLDKGSKTHWSEFAFHFIHRKTRYQYMFRVDREKVLLERLTIFPKGYPQKVFERDISKEKDDQWTFGSWLKGEKHKLASLTRPDALFLSVGANLNNEQLTDVLGWFRRYLLIVGSESFMTTSSKILHDGGLRAAIGSLLRFADLGIEAVEAEEISPDKISLPDELPEELRKVLRQRMTAQVEVSTQHRTLEGGAERFGFNRESHGTRNFFSYLGPCLDALRKGRTIFIDELDSSLHPLLVKKLITLFNDPTLNLNGAQLVCSTHDTTLLDQNIFRRDQIWFTERDENAISHIYPLLDFKPRKGEAFQRGYLAGRYGAIPFHETMPDLTEWMRSSGGDENATE